MQIGKPLREVVVEPLELPEPLRPATVPEKTEQEQPVTQPVRED